MRTSLVFLIKRHLATIFVRFTDQCFFPMDQVEVDLSIHGGRNRGATTINFFQGDMGTIQLLYLTIHKFIRMIVGLATVVISSWITLLRKINGTL